MIIPLTLIPKYYAIRNTLRRRVWSSKNSLRDLVILAFALTIMIVLYRGTMWSLTKFNSDPTLIFLPPSIPLGLIFAVLFVMLILSNVVTAVSTLYFGADLELLLASPLSGARFFYGKVLYIFLSSSWTSMIFIAPLIGAFGVHHHAALSFYLLAAAALIPYFLIPTSLAVIMATLFVRYIPPRRLKVLLVLAALIIISGISVGISLLKVGSAAAQDKGQILGLMNMLSVANMSWIPSMWLSSALQELLLFGGAHYRIYISLLLGVAMSVTALAYLVMQWLHFDAYTIARSLGGSKLTSEREVLRPWLFSLPIKQRIRALSIKDTLLFVREITSTIQILMLGGICLIYLFNVRLFGDFSGMSTEMRRWWESFFFISNWCIGAFVTTGISTRFVFPSLSHEGKSIWILQTSSMPMRELIEAKFALWSFPLAIISSAILSIGGYAVGFDSWVIMINFVSGLFLAYGITGLALGLGARFAHFEWEHASELIASFGSLVFMLSSMILILASLVITWCAYFLGVAYLSDGDSSRYIAGALGVVLSGAFNVIVAKVSMKGGVEAVLQKLG
jgi:ABC-2 type transport system permease protein